MLPSPIHPSFPKDCIGRLLRHRNMHGRGHTEMTECHAIKCVRQVDNAPRVAIASRWFVGQAIVFFVACLPREIADDKKDCLRYPHASCTTDQYAGSENQDSAQSD